MYRLMSSVRATVASPVKVWPWGEKGPKVNLTASFWTSSQATIPAEKVLGMARKEKVTMFSRQSVETTWVL